MESMTTSLLEMTAGTVLHQKFLSKTDLKTNKQTNKPKNTALFGFSSQGTKMIIF